MNVIGNRANVASWSLFLKVWYLWMMMEWLELGTCITTKIEQSMNAKLVQLINLILTFFFFPGNNTNFINKSYHNNHRKIGHLIFGFFYLLFINHLIFLRPLYKYVYNKKIYHILIKSKSKSKFTY